MRDIKVSTKTFAAIWSVRRAGEEKENDILERLLEENCRQMGLPKTRASKTEPLLTTAYEREEGQKHNEQAANYEGWLGIVFNAFRALGDGAHHLKDVYKVVRESLPPEKHSVEKLKETVRGTIYDNCPTSKRFKNHHSVFRHATEKGRGYWALID